MPQFLYQILPGDRPELVTDPAAWTDVDRGVSTAHFEYISNAAQRGVVILAGRSSDGVGPAIVIFEADNEESASRFMLEDPFFKQGLFVPSLHPFRVALSSGGEASTSTA